ncbi:hypothetical protein ACC807_33540 [Rhizobium ruizarguesonis]|nr:hypothetical protein E0H40_35610 [Rhizobium leguminosarum bv. viciae]
MNLGEIVPDDEPVARAVIYPTHLPAKQLSDESLLDFRGDNDPIALGEWGFAYSLSVTCLSLHASDEVHRGGLLLADNQNEARPLPMKEESAAYGHQRSYLGYYEFKTACATPSPDGKDQTVTIFWPDEPHFPAHANCCIRISADTVKRDRVNRRIRVIGLIWRALRGPTRYLYDVGQPFADVLNELPLEPMPK